MGILVKDGGIWKDSEPYVRDAGIWKPVDTGYVKDAGVWKETYSAGFFASGSWETGVEGWGNFASSARTGGGARTGVYCMVFFPFGPEQIDYTIPAGVATASVKLSFWIKSQSGSVQVFAKIGSGSFLSHGYKSTSGSSYTYQEVTVSNPGLEEVILRISNSSIDYDISVDDWQIEGTN